MALRRYGNIGLEQFFTKESVAKDLVDMIFRIAGNKMKTFVDTSAGTGYVMKLIQQRDVQVYGYDIDTSNVLPCMKEHIVESDWLLVEDPPFPRDSVVGFNPPFGLRGKLVRKFATHAAMLCPDAPFLFFIGPNLGRNWAPPGFKEHSRLRLDDDSFETIDGRTKRAPTSFHVFEPGTPDEIVVPPLPDGFTVVRLQDHCNSGHNERILINRAPQNNRSIVLRSAGGNAGKAAIIFGRAEYEQWTIKTTGAVPSKCPTDLVSNGYHIINVPEEWQGQKRFDFLQKLCPVLVKIRHEACGKINLDRVDIALALNLL